MFLEHPQKTLVHGALVVLTVNGMNVLHNMLASVDARNDVMHLSRHFASVRVHAGRPLASMHPLPLANKPLCIRARMLRFGLALSLLEYVAASQLVLQVGCLLLRQLDSGDVVELLDVFAADPCEHARCILRPEVSVLVKRRRLSGHRDVVLLVAKPTALGLSGRTRLFWPLLELV